MAAPCPVDRCHLRVDVVLEANDGSLYGAHARNVEAFSASLLPLDRDPSLLTVTLVKLTEDAEVVSLLCRLSTAVEKYKVYSAIGVCKLKMEYSVVEHPYEVLQYASTTDYDALRDRAMKLCLNSHPIECFVNAKKLGLSDLMDEAAAKMLDLPLSTVEAAIRGQADWQTTLLTWTPTTDEENKKAARRANYKDMTQDIAAIVISTLEQAALFAPIPYLQQAAGMAITLVDMVQTTSDNKPAFKALAADACGLVYTATNVWKDRGKDGNKIPQDLENHLRELLKEMRDTMDFAEARAARGYLARFVSHKSDAERILSHRLRLKDALDRFGMQSHITVRDAVSRIQDQQDAILAALNRNSSMTDGTSSESPQTVLVKRSPSSKGISHDHSTLSTQAPRDPVPTPTSSTGFAHITNHCPGRSNVINGDYVVNNSTTNTSVTNSGNSANISTVNSNNIYDVGGSGWANRRGRKGKGAVWASSGKDDKSIHPELFRELLKTIRVVIQFAKASSARRPFFRTLFGKWESRKIASYKARFEDILDRLGGVVTSIDEAVRPILLQNEAILAALNRYRPQAGMATSTGPPPLAPPLAPPQFTQNVTKTGGRGWGGRHLEGGQMNLLGRGSIAGLNI
ncbi:hypothetical protein CCMSSC00406_0004321 [Pleurotus cornucopiae]|uniref:Uncharacterized protein n=1 Tax=Pleurotus cornucopiae TaxID=5321 RepID=A0ACB7JA50_PLECO|nr:hypothetical protein CCMSSC00406_0004321 [Pleurotus cornucopiae]